MQINHRKVHDDDKAEDVEQFPTVDSEVDAL